MSARRFAKQGLLGLALLATFVGGPADARRGGSFGSRGSRTYSAPSSTSLTPGYTAPVQRSMTDRPAYGSQSYRPSYQPGFAQPQRRGLFGGFGGGLLTGIVAGGLIGHFFGHGYGYGGGGAGGGFLATLIQIALIGGVLWLLFRLFAGRSSTPTYSEPTYNAGPGYGGGYDPQPGYGAPPQVDISISGADQEEFERLLTQLQDAFSREDYGALREITTPEVMSFLAEELSDNATHGRRNEVSGTKLLDGEVSEGWNEDGKDYATVALRYESIDLMRDRATGAIQSGSTQPTTTTELWTFVRPSGGYNRWKVSAIQDG